MIYGHGDIDDDQIRIISSRETERKKKRRRKRFVFLWCIAVAFLIGALVLMFFIPEETVEEKTMSVELPQQPPVEEETPLVEITTDLPPYTIRKDTTINDIALSIFTPFNATPVLEVGNDVLSDTSAVLIAQAADIRGDNGKIAGSFVLKGELVGKGEAKAGFCSIINGELTVGVADASPMFEEAMTTDGYFFRQYPLVVGGQVVENKPKGKSIRRALADIGGKFCVITSRKRVSFHDFSQALVDAGVRNAIYLVGGEAICGYRDDKGQTVLMGQTWDKRIKNINYIVWR